MKQIWGFLGILCWSIMAVAGDIRAIVNDTPISDFDVRTRAKMIMLQQAGRVTDPTPAIEKAALEDLIDERLKRQEAQRQHIQVSEEEIADALSHLEQQNGLSDGGFQALLAEQNIPYQTLRSQTAANLSWLKILHAKGQKLAVTPAEIKARKKIIKSELAKESLSFAEIVLETEKEALDVRERLLNGADFGHMVDLYSVADSRTVGGRIEGVTRTYYGNDVAEVLDDLSVGELSDPVKVPDGYALILMLNRREAVTGDTVAVWELAQALVPAGNPLHKTLEMTAVEGCDAFRELVQEAGLEDTYQAGLVSPAQLPSDMAPLLKEAPFKEVLGPIRIPQGGLYFMKCDEHQKRVMPTDDEIRAQVETEKMELISFQLLSELKRDAVIEYK